MPKDKLILEVKFTKIGNKIKYELPVRMFCERQNNEIANTMTLDKNDSTIIVWLGKNPDRLFKKSNVIFKKVFIGQVYDKCDKVKSK